LTLDKKAITALLEALCDRPLSGDTVQPSAELQALCRAATQAMEQTGDVRSSAEPAPNEDADQGRAALASILSGAGAEVARPALVEAVLRDPSVRLDAQSAMAFVDGIERSLQVAPVRLVEQVLASNGITPLRPTAERQGAGIDWSPFAGSWSAQRRRMAVACAVLLVAAGLSWPVYRQFSIPAPEDGPLSSAGKTTIEPPSVGNVAVEPKSALGIAQPCDPQNLKGDSATEKIEQGRQPSAAAKIATDRECDARTGRQLGNQPAGGSEAIAAHERAEANRRAAARAAIEAAGKAGATQADQGVDRGAVPPPHGTATAPAAMPATPPSAAGRPH
jgi:hypothetical protein